MKKERKTRKYHPLVFSKTSYYPILPECIEPCREAIYFLANSTATIYLSGIGKWDKRLGTGKRFKTWLKELRKIIGEYYWANEISDKEYQDALDALKYENVMDWLLNRRLNEVHLPEQEQ